MRNREKHDKLCQIFQVTPVWANTAKLSYTNQRIKTGEEIENKLEVFYLSTEQKDKWLPYGFLVSVRKQLDSLRKTKSFLLKRQRYLKAKELSIRNGQPLPKELQPNISLDEIKEQVKIRTILEQAGIEIHRNNKFLAVWRNDNNPSCDFNEKLNVYIDRATGEGDSVIGLYAKIYGVSIAESIKELSAHI